MLFVRAIRMSQGLKSSRVGSIQCARESAQVFARVTNGQNSDVSFLVRKLRAANDCVVIVAESGWVTEVKPS